MESLYNPWSVSLVIAYFIWYAVPAYLVIAGKVCALRFTRKEALLLAIFLTLVFAEVFQLKMQTHDISFAQRALWGLPRYFSAFGPFLWLWAAWLIARATLIRRRGFRNAALVLAGLFVAYVLGNECIRYFAFQCRYSDGVDALVAAENVAPVIRRDYAGPKKFDKIPYNPWEYYTARRPVVFGNFGAAAWAARGQSEGANIGIYPMPPDYVMMNADKKGYNGGVNLNPEEFEPLAETSGTTCRWILFRRKGIPHNYNRRK